MTAIAPNLGKLFTSCTKRPATPEDRALLAPGDWISERECPWSWQFKNFCQDMTVGVWEGKEFFIPTNLLMVCTVIEGNAVEKFLESDCKFKVGDRIQHKVDPQGLGYSGVVLEINEKAQSARVRMEDGHTHTFYLEGLKLWLEPIKFKKGDRVRDTFPSSKGRIGVITKTSQEWSMVLWDGVQKPERSRHLEIVSAFKIGDAYGGKQRFAVCPGVTNECEIIGFLDSKYRVRWSLKGDEQIVEAMFLAELKSVQPDVEPEKFFMNESGDDERWNSAHFGSTPHQIEEDGQVTIFYDASGEPPDPDDFETIEEYEEAWKQWENLQQEYCLQEEAGIQKLVSPQDINPSGQLKTTPTPQPSTGSDSQAPSLLNKTLPNSPTNLSEISTLSISSLGVAHAQISVLLENAPGLKELVDSCFLNTSDSLKSSSLQLFFGNKFQQSYQVEEGKTSSKSLMCLQRWGMWGTGKCGTETATSPKTESDCSVWVFTGDIRATLPKMGKKSLQEIFNAVNSVTGEKIDEAYTLKASTPKLGTGNKSHPNTFVSIPVKVYVDGVAEATESPALCSGGWQHRSSLHRDKRGASFAVLYRAAGGDRIYHDQAPCLRSPNNCGTGAYKIREYQGETYLERPINATEAERLMGWEVGSTAIGINKEGDEIFISQTQRIKILGNGIIVGEIIDILTAIKPILLRRLKSEIPEHLEFAYRQLRQKNYTHREAVTLLTDSR